MIAKVEDEKKRKLFMYVEEHPTITLREMKEKLTAEALLKTVVSP